MRKSLWIMLAVMVVAVSAPNAHADSSTDGTITFTVSSGGPTPTGSFVLDTTTDELTSLTVNWDGAVFKFAAVTFPVPFSFLEADETWCAVAPASGTECEVNPSPVFELGVTGPEPVFASFPELTSIFTDFSASAGGTYSLSETEGTAPEPSSLALISLGLGALLLMRKRTSHPSAA